MAISKDNFDELVTAIRLIAHGGQSGPTGLEMLSMAVDGAGGSPGGNGGLAGAIDRAGDQIAQSNSEVADANRGIAEALQAIADAINDTKEIGK